MNFHQTFVITIFGDKNGLYFINVFSFILTRIMLGLLSPGSAKADVG